MASLPPIDPTSPPSVAGASFPTVRKGFDPFEVRDLLRRVAAEMERLYDERDALEDALDEARSRSQAERPRLDEATVTALLGEEAAAVLRTAQEGAAQIRAKAEESLARTLREAEDDSARMRNDAELEAARVRQEGRDEAAALVAAAQQEGREMVAEARAVRERMLQDLARRRDAAREQIARLHADRDRLIEVFRAARGAVDGVLGDLGELPAEADLGDLGPVTGDIPVLGEVDVTTFAAAAQLVAGELDQTRERHPAAHAAPVDSVDRSVDAAEEVAPEQTEEAGEEGGADEAERADADVEQVEDVEASGAPVEEVEASGADVEEVEAFDEPVEPVAPPVEEIEPAGMPREEVEAPGEPVEASGEPVEPSGEGEDGVEALFAKLKAASAASVAQDVLSGSGDVAAKVDPEEADPDVAEAPLESPHGGPDVHNLAARRAEATAPVRTVLSRVLKRVLADEQNDVLDHLRRVKVLPSLDELVGDLPTHAARYGDAAREQLRLAAIAGVQSLGPGDPDGAAAVLDDTNALDRSVAEVATELAEPLRERLASILSGATDPMDAAAQARTAYRDWKTERLDQVATDLTLAAYGRGAFVALAPGTPVCWALDPDGPGCPDAEDNVLAGTVPAGEPFPTGHRHAPAYPGCRCLVVPVPD